MRESERGGFEVTGFPQTRDAGRKRQSSAKRARRLGHKVPPDYHRKEAKRLLPFNLVHITHVYTWINFIRRSFPLPPNLCPPRRSPLSAQILYIVYLVTRVYSAMGWRLLVLQTFVHVPDKQICKISAHANRELVTPHVEHVSNHSLRKTFLQNLRKRLRLQ